RSATRSLPRLCPANDAGSGSCRRAQDDAHAARCPQNQSGKHEAENEPDCFGRQAGEIAEVQRIGCVRPAPIERIVGRALAVKDLACARVEVEDAIAAVASVTGTYRADV